MQGQADWTTLIWIVSMVGGAGLFGFVVAWRISIIRSADKRVIDAELAAIDQRVRLIENQNASTLVILEHMKEFRDDVSTRIDQLLAERRHDMASIQGQLNAIANFERMNRLSMEDRR